MTTVIDRTLPIADRLLRPVDRDLSGDSASGGPFRIVCPDDS